MQLKQREQAMNHLKWETVGSMEKKKKKKKKSALVEAWRNSLFMSTKNFSLNNVRK